MKNFSFPVEDKNFSAQNNRRTTESARHPKPFSYHGTLFFNSLYSYKQNIQTWLLFSIMRCTMNVVDPIEPTLKSYAAAGRNHSRGKIAPFHSCLEVPSEDGPTIARWKKDIISLSQKPTGVRNEIGRNCMKMFFHVDTNNIM